MIDDLLIHTIGSRWSIDKKMIVNQQTKMSDIYVNI